MIAIKLACEVKIFDRPKVILLNNILCSVKPDLCLNNYLHWVSR